MVDVNELLFSEWNLLRGGMIYLFLPERQIHLSLTGYPVFLCNPRLKSSPCWSPRQKFSWLQGTLELVSQQLWGFAPLPGRGRRPLHLCLVPHVQLWERALLGTESKCCFAAFSSLQFSILQRNKKVEPPSLNLFLFSPCTLFFFFFFSFLKKKKKKKQPFKLQPFK